MKIKPEHLTLLSITLEYLLQAGKLGIKRKKEKENRKNVGRLVIFLIVNANVFHFRFLLFLRFRFIFRC